MAAYKILYVNQEITPYVDDTYISTIGRFLPQSVQESGIDIRTFMPRYGLVSERRNQLHEVIRLSGQNIIIKDNDHPLIIKVASIPSVRMQIPANLLCFVLAGSEKQAKQQHTNKKTEIFQNPIF